MQAKSTTLILLGIIGSLWVASRGISAIIRGLNNSYTVKESRKFIKLNFIVLISTIGISFMTIFAFIMLVFGEIIGSYVFGLIGAQTLFSVIWPILRYVIPFALMLITFYLIYRYAPNKKLKFNNIIIGAIFTTFGLIITSLLFSFYVNSFAIYEKVYGSLGGVIALIGWLYINTLIILLGGELNAISSNFENKENINTSERKVTEEYL